MSDMASAVPEPAAVQIGIPLDLAPLLTPYGRYPRLSVRVVQLPPLVCLSKGTHNEDRSWSLAPDDLDSLELLLPEDSEPPIALAVRIVGIDKNENATIIGQFDVPLFSVRRDSRATGGPQSAQEVPADWQRRTERRVAAALRLGERRAALALAEAEAQWEAEDERRLSEQVDRLDQGWQRKMRSERAARDEVETRAADAAQRLTELADDLESARAARGEAETRAADAAQRLTELSDDLESACAARDDAETKAAEAAQKLTELSSALEAALARAATAEAAEADRADDLQRHAAEAETRLAQELAKQAAASEAKWAAESEDRTAAAVQRAVQEAEAAAEARLAEARALWQEDANREVEAIKQRFAQAESEMPRPEAGSGEAEAEWRAESERRLSELTVQLKEEWEQKLLSERVARGEADTRAAEAARKLTELSGELETVRARAAAAEAADAGRDGDRERSTAEAEAQLAQALAKQAAAGEAKWEAESEARIAAAVKKAEAAAQARLREAEAKWQGEAQAALATAQGQWRAEEARRLATARAEWQKTALAAANKGRRSLRSVARKQGLVNAGRHVRRLGLVAAGLTAVFFLYSEFKPAVVTQWLPKGRALVSDIESAARSQLQALTEPDLLHMSVVAEGANLRSGPSTASDVLTTLPRGTDVTVLERRGDWIRIQAGSGLSEQGWLHHSLLEAAE